MENFTIFGEQKTLTQWDVGRKIAVRIPCEYVHFANAAMTEAMVCQVRESDGQRIADIPDEVLQVAGVLRVYAFTMTPGENYTKWAENLFIRARPKPENYLYTPTTGVSWDQLVGRVEGLEEKTARKPDYTAEEVGARPDTWMPTAEEVGAAPAGFGFGEKMTYVDMTADAYSGMTFTEAVDTVLATMPGYSCAQVQFYDPDNGYHANKFVGKLWKYTANYVTLEAINYSGYKAIMRKTGGTWQPWEWENPPMNYGTEYRTTERYDGKVVYAKTISLGALPNSTNKTVTHGIDTSAFFISLLGVAKSSTGGTFQQFPFINNAGEIVAKMHLAAAGIMVTSYSDVSGYAGYAILRYTK